MCLRFYFGHWKLVGRKKNHKYLIEGKSTLENWLRLLKCSFLQTNKVMKLTLTLTPPLLFLSIPGSPFTPCNRNNKEDFACLQRTWKIRQQNPWKHQYWGHPQDQPHFKKSALYRRDNSDSPLLSATPKETGGSSELWAVRTAKQDIITNIFVVIIIIICQNDWKAFKVYGIRDWTL